MSSVSPILEGALSAKPLLASSGLSRGVFAAGTVAGEAADSPQNAALAELNGLISSIGSLSAQAQGLPLTAPTLPGLPQGQNYRPQATDYTQFADDSN